MTGERARRIVRRTHIEDTGVGSGGQHALHIVRPCLGQWNVHHARAHDFCGAAAGFVSRICGDITPRGRRECGYGVIQRGTRSGKRRHVFRLEALLFGEPADQVFRQVEQVASTIRRDVCHSLPRHRRRAKRVFVGIEPHSALGRRLQLCVGEHGLGHDAARQCRRGNCRQLQERPARKR